MILGIYGSGGLGREVLEIAKQINSVSKKWEELVFIDDFANITLKNGVKLFSFSQIQQTFSKDGLEINIAVGEPADRKILHDNVTSKGYRLATLVHPSVYIPATTEILAGTTICAFAVISVDVKIGADVYIQSQALVGHDCIIEDHTVIGPQVSFGGSCYVGQCTYIGMAVLIKEKVKVGSYSIIGMGSSVLRDIPDEVIALGNPARVMKKNENHRVFG